MASMLFRLFTTALGVIGFCVLVYAVVWLLNRGVQLMAEKLGYEIKDFFVWIREALPKRKRKKTR